MESSSVQPTPMGTMQNGLATPYNFAMGDLFAQAWHQVRGFKATFWGAVGFVFLIGMALGLINLFSLFPGVNKDLVQGIGKIVVTLVFLPLMIGISMLSVRRAVSLPVKATDIFNYYRCFWRILGVYIGQMLIFAVIGLLIGLSASLSQNAPTLMISLLFLVLSSVLILLLIYLAIGYLFAMVLVAEKNLGIFQSLKASRKAVSQHWFKIFFAFILLDIVIAISAIPVFIGLIWTLPWLNMFCGMLYRTMFGVEEVR